MIAKASAGKAWARVVACLAFVAFGVFLAVAAPTDDTGLRIFGWIVVAIFLGVIAMQLKTATTTGDQLTIDDLGVFDRRITDRYVPWSEITGVQVIYVKAQPFIYLTVEGDPLRFTDHPGKRALLKLNQYHLRGVMIVPHGLDVTFQQILAELEARLAAGVAR